MVKKVLKFGGTSVGTAERIQHVAKIIEKEQSEKNKVIVVVSAMAGNTNQLIKLSREISEEFNKRELDVLLSSGALCCRVLTYGVLCYGNSSYVNPPRSSKLKYSFLKSSAPYSYARFPLVPQSQC